MWTPNLKKSLLFHWTSEHLQKVTFIFIMFIHVLKTTDLRSAATATLFSPMSIRPQREAHFAWGMEPRRLGHLDLPFSP